MNTEELFEILKKINEPKGYYFNKDKKFTLDVLAGLVKNKERYGYMSCPCRLAAGDREKDRDIMCPCAYREADVKQYGACFCGLYVSLEWNEDKTPHFFVPERRPADKFF
ncbi:MAG: ferredoxin-thioredoxin reductase catalytic domain-containing protein [bacterium]|nr:ferredoxin-thioredoxin reductase catalytic domain-containing protein [bacterium]